MAASKARLLTTALLGGIGALALLIVLELVLLALGPRFAGPDEPADELGAAPITGLNIRNIGLEQDFEEVAARPIFTWNRKPVPTDPGEPQVETSEIDSRWELSAIIADGASQFAYFTPRDGGLPTRLAEGMYFEKWRVLAIGREQVVLASGDSEAPEGEYEQKTFRLKDVSEAKPQPKARSSLAERRRAARERADQNRGQPAEAGSATNGQKPSS